MHSSSSGHLGECLTQHVIALTLPDWKNPLRGQPCPVYVMLLVNSSGLGTGLAPPRLGD